MVTHGFSDGATEFVPFIQAYLNRYNRAVESLVYSQCPENSLKPDLIKVDQFLTWKKSLQIPQIYIPGQ